MNKTKYLTANQRIIAGKSVLDLACHDGQSTRLIHQLGAEKIYAVDIRNHLVAKAANEISGNIDFIVGDITDPDLLQNLVPRCHSVICLGVLYHLFDHFRFFSRILKPNIEHVLIETVCGPETINPEMFWGFETTDQDLHGWMDNSPIIPHGTPNLSWIVHSARIFGFDFDWVHYYGKQDLKERCNITLEEYHAIAGPDWPSYDDVISEKALPEFVSKELDQMLKEYPWQHRRMILRLYNTKKIDSVSLSLKDHCFWPY